MKNTLFLIGLILMLAACSSPSSDNSPEHSEHTTELHMLAYTLYTDKTELFVEFKPLIVGEESRLAVHLTKLGSSFTSLNEGSVTVCLVSENKGIRNTINTASSPGIFRSSLTPQSAGNYKLIFDIKTKDFTDQHVIAEVKVYPNSEIALQEQPSEDHAGGISYLKEQAWKIDFATEQVRFIPFAEVIQSTGQILSSQSDEEVLVAKASGIVAFAQDNVLPGKKIKSGELLFTIKGSGLNEENLTARRQQAEQELQAAKKDFARAQELVKDKIISEKEFEVRKLEFEKARIRYSSFSGAGQVSSSVSGFLRTVNVRNGQHVELGQTLGTISRNEQLMLRADISQKHFSQISSIESINIRLNNGTVLGSEELNSKVISIGKANDPTTMVIPVFFSINSKAGLLPGMLVDIFMYGGKNEYAMTVPVSALIEEQGIFYVYVQLAGETFEKREVKPGNGNGLRVQILSGIKEGERVVTKGAYQIKLATMSGSMPAHGHEH